VRNGKGLVLLHAAVDNFEDFPEAKTMVGGIGAGHPWGHYSAWRFKVEEPKHPITAHLDPSGFSMKDEQYQYDQNHTGRHNVRVLVSLDMSDAGTAKDENGKLRGFRTDGLNPVVWVRREGRGRVFVNGFGHNNETCWDCSMLQLNLAGIQYALGDLKADDAILPNNAVNPEKSPALSLAGSAGLQARWWNNNSFTGDPVLANVVTNFNPVVDSPSVPFPAATPPLGPEYVSARFTGTLIPKVTGKYRFVSNADDYVGLWVNGVEEIHWSGHRAEDRFSTHSFNLVKDVPLDIRLDYRQDRLGYKLTLRLAHQPDGAQIDFGPSVGEFTPVSQTGAKEPARRNAITNASRQVSPYPNCVKIFNGMSFEGWEADPSTWSTSDGLRRQSPRVPV
jgi:type 1 glutamine amidotransferase